MSIFPEDDRPKPKSVHEIGQDLSMLSLAEIDRLIETRARKDASRSAADAFFRKPA